MASKPSPGSFLMETASIGFTIVTSILNLGASRKLKDLAAEISLSASLLSEAGREVDQNSRYFSGTFESKFKIITEKCRTEYEKVRAALEAVQSYDTPIPAIRNNVMYISDQPPSQPWKKLVWGLEKSQYDSSKVVEEIKGCSEQAWMINYVILLVVIQKHAQERDLTLSERSRLTGLKKTMGNLVSALRGSDVASLMAFSLGSNMKAVNTAQITRNDKLISEESIPTDDVSATVTAYEASIQSKEKILVVEKMGELKVDKPTDPEPAKEKDRVYEMYRSNDVGTQEDSTVTIFKLFGLLPFKVRRKTQFGQCYINKVPISQDEIKAFMESHPASLTANSVMDALLSLPSMMSQSVYTMVNNKNAPNFTRYSPTKGEYNPYNAPLWSVKSVHHIDGMTPKARFWQTLRCRPSAGVIVILEGPSAEEAYYHNYGAPLPADRRPPYHHGPRLRLVDLPPVQSFPAPPPPPIRMGGQAVPRPRSTLEVEEKRSTTEIELTKDETITVVNDFLATFSTLYQDIPVEKRGEALKACVVDDDSDYDSDDTSSTGLRSPIDD